jgi:hypothetical protein
MSRSAVKLTCKVTAALIALLILNGCDQVRQKLADLLSPPSAMECLVRVQKLVDAGDFQQAVLTGEDYLKDKNLASGGLHLAVAKAYLELGDAAKALQHTQEANGESEIHSSVKGAPHPEERVQNLEAGDASVTETSKGTVLKAGDALVVLPK